MTVPGNTAPYPGNTVPGIAIPYPGITVPGIAIPYPGITVPGIIPIPIYTPGIIPGIPIPIGNIFM